MKSSNQWVFCYYSKNIHRALKSYSVVPPVFSFLTDTQAFRFGRVYRKIENIFLCLCMCAKSLQSCLTLCDHNLPGSSVHGTLQARILKWIAMPSSRGSSQPRDWTHVSFISCTGKWILCHYAIWEAHLHCIMQIPPTLFSSIKMYTLIFS